MKSSKKQKILAVMLAASLVAGTATALSLTVSARNHSSSDGCHSQNRNLFHVVINIVFIVIAFPDASFIFL